MLVIELLGIEKSAPLEAETLKGFNLEWCASPIQLSCARENNYRDVVAGYSFDLSIDRLQNEPRSPRPAPSADTAAPVQAILG